MRNAIILLIMFSLAISVPMFTYPAPHRSRIDPRLVGISKPTKIIVSLNTPVERVKERIEHIPGLTIIKTWHHAIDGFYAVASPMAIAMLSRVPAVAMIEPVKKFRPMMAYAAKQVGVRPTLWNMGYRGDPNTAIAILDTGIDGNHTALSGKIISWYDPVSSTTSPVDPDGHGTHCAGIAAGNGFSSTLSDGRISASYIGEGLEELDTGIYTIMTINVTSPGEISVRFYWVSSNSISVTSVSLWYGNSLSSSGWIKVKETSTTEGKNAYWVNYTVASVGLYHIRVNIVSGSGTLDMVATAIWPFDEPGDGYLSWTGIAPDSKLVGVNVFSSDGAYTNTILDGIEWVISHAEKYGITVASLSLGGDVSFALDKGVESLVKNGIVTVVAAGNDGPGGNHVYSPGRAELPITVGAVDRNDNITYYSSEGGWFGDYIKPDVVAPGGVYSILPVFSADTNLNDGAWKDLYPNNLADMQGTSMATPLVAGIAQLLIDALGGKSYWFPASMEKALLVKMAILMTATETWPLHRGSSSEGNPTLDHGLKDPQEGYGIVNPQAAIDALTKSYTIGDTATATLYSAQASLGYINSLDNPAVRAPHAWARKITLNRGTYRFSLQTPDSAEFELYIYRNSPDTRGEPVLLARTSPRNSTAFFSFHPINKTLEFAAPYSGDYYLVVKCIYGSGTFTLSSQSVSDAPVVTLLSPKEGVFSNNFEVKASVQATSSVSVYLAIDGKPYANMTPTGSYWTTTVDVDTITAVNHTLTVWAEDFSGRVGRAWTNVLVTRPIGWHGNGISIANTWEGITNYAWCGIDGEDHYPNNANMKFTIAVDTLGHSSVSIELKHMFMLEENVDIGKVFVDANGTWVELASFTGKSSWRMDEWNVSWITQPKIYISFALITDNTITDKGWFLDWVKVSYKGIPLYFNDFNTDISWNKSSGSEWHSVSLTWGLDSDNVIFKHIPSGSYLDNIHASIYAFFSEVSEVATVELSGTGSLEMGYDYIVISSSVDYGHQWDIHEYHSYLPRVETRSSSSGIIGIKITVYTDANTETYGFTLANIEINQVNPTFMLIITTVIGTAVGGVAILLIVLALRARRKEEEFGYPAESEYRGYGGYGGQGGYEEGGYGRYTGEYDKYRYDENEYDEY